MRTRRVLDHAKRTRFVGDHYQFNLNTRGWAAGAYRFFVTLNDGRRYTMDVRLR